MTATSFLGGYRVIEVGDQAGMFCGKLLGDLGCDVIRVGSPQGDVERLREPRVTWDGDEVSVQWLAYNTSKRSIALDIERPEGRELLDRLLDRADVLIASGSAAWLEQHRLRPHEVRRERSRLVAVAITPFGLDGPYRDYRTSDLVAQAAGGFVYMNGDRDRAPVRVSEPQTWSLAGAEAAFVALAALYSAQRDGVGEGIDLSIHEAVVAGLVSVAPWWQLEQRIPERNALTQMGRDVLIRNIWPCKDGFVTYRLSVGQGLGSRNLGLIHWMDETGEAGDLLAVPWEYVSTVEVSQEVVSSWQSTLERFFAGRTKQELYDGALVHRVMLFPVLELSDILEDRQLQARGFLLPFADAEGRQALFPGAFFRALAGIDPRPSAPARYGAHTDEVLTEHAGCVEGELRQLRATGVIG